MARLLTARAFAPLLVIPAVGVSAVGCAPRPVSPGPSQAITWTCRGRSGPLERYPFEGFEVGQNKGLRSAEVGFAFRRVQPGVRACAQRAASASGLLPEGRVHVQLSLDAAGRVERTCVAPEGALDEATLVCVASQLEAVHVDGATSPLTVRTVVVPSSTPLRTWPSEPFARRCDEIDVVAVGSPLPAQGPDGAGAPLPPLPAAGAPEATLEGHHGSDPGGPMTAAVVARRASIRGCYQAGLDVNPDLEGVFRFELGLGSSGQVRRVCSHGLGLSEPVRLCISRALRDVRFPPPPSPSYTFSGSFSFVGLPPKQWPASVTAGTTVGAPSARDAPVR